MMVHRFATKAEVPSGRRASYQRGTEATSGRLAPALKDPTTALFVLGAERNVTKLLTSDEGTTQSAAAAKSIRANPTVSSRMKQAHACNDDSAHTFCRNFTIRMTSNSFLVFPCEVAYGFRDLSNHLPSH